MKIFFVFLVSIPIRISREIRFWSQILILWQKICLKWKDFHVIFWKEWTCSFLQIHEPSSTVMSSSWAHVSYFDGTSMGQVALYLCFHSSPHKNDMTHELYGNAMGHLANVMQVALLTLEAVRLDLCDSHMWLYMNIRLNVVLHAR